ncbi:MAG: F0F1 ATP synthase subunit A [Actinomycetes bacterium]
MISTGILAAVHADTEIEVGGHAVTTQIFGLTINLDIVWVTLFAAGVVLTLGLLMRRKATDGVPGKLQLFWEVLVEQVQDLTDSALGPAGRRFVPLAVTIFIFLLTCNWIEVIPSGHNPEWFPAPTADVNLPLAMALTVIFIVHYNSVKARGWRGYFHHYLTPYPVMLPINIIEEITKPITLTFRLFGNMFASVLMISVITALLPIYLVPVGELVWKPFALFVGAIQAFIFALLTIIYLSIATSTEEH